MLCQNADDLADQPSNWEVVTEAQPSDVQRAELAFAWAACRHVKSNAIVLARDNALVGVGAGQMSRVDAVEISIKKAGERTQGAVLASDAFFPFDDSIHRAAEAGIAAVIQPGGFPPRRRSNRRLQSARPTDDLHRPTPLQALSGLVSSELRRFPEPQACDSPGNPPKSPQPSHIKLFQ